MRKDAAPGVGEASFARRAESHARKSSRRAGFAPPASRRSFCPITASRSCSTSARLSASAARDDSKSMTSAMVHGSGRLTGGLLRGGGAGCQVEKARSFVFSLFTPRHLPL